MKKLNCQYCKADFESPRKRKYCGSLCRERAGHKTKNPRSAPGLQLVEENRRLLESARKRCSKCRQIKPVDEFRNNTSGLGGKSQQCKSCLYEKDKSYRKTPAGRALRVRMKARARRKAGATPRPVLAARAAESARRAKAKRRGMVWRRLWITRGETSQERYARKYREDGEFQLKEKMRRQMRKAAKRDGVGEYIRQALRRGGHSCTVERLLGYSIDDLRTHLERQFTKGMTWEAVNSGDIHIDHIIPQSSFDLTNEDEWRSCWSLPNLRPLWAKDNLSKAATVVTLL